MFLLETARLKEQIREIQDKLGVTKEELEKASVDYGNMKEEYHAVEEQMDSIDDSIEHYKTKLNETNLLKQQLENEIALLKEQINSAHTADRHFAKRSDAIHEEIKTREESLAQLSAETSELKEQLAMKQKEEAEAKERLIDTQSRIATLTSDIEKNKNDIIELLNNRASTRAKIQRYDTMMEQIQARKAEMQEQLSDSQSEIQRESGNLKSYEEALKEISGKIIRSRVKLMSRR